MLGPLLSRTLARNLGGNASRSELDKLSEPLKKLVYRYPMAKSWLEAGLTHETFPSTKVTPQDKSMFLKKIIRYIISLFFPKRPELKQPPSLPSQLHPISLYSTDHVTVSGGPRPQIRSLETSGSQREARILLTPHE